MARRHGFALLDLMAVLVIVAVLIALLAPAVLRVREASLRTQCKLNLKQIGRALQLYHDAKRHFPPGGDEQGIACHAHLLPYLQQSALFQRIRFDENASCSANERARSHRIATFLCPSDPAAMLPVGCGGNNYVANHGSGVTWDRTETQGVFFFGGATTTLASITDGAGNTAAFAERRIGDFDNAVVTEATDIFACFEAPNETADAAMDGCARIDTGNLAHQWRSNSGGSWLHTFHMPLYWHGGLPNTRSCAFSPERMLVTANSAHDGGLNLLFCDGSVRFIANDIHLTTWRSLGTRSGGELQDTDY